MPNNVDFSKVRNIQKIKVSPKGWIENITIELGTSEELYTIPSYFWRIEGTQHTFMIPTVRMDFISQGNYAKHFEEVLEYFREDYLNWIENYPNIAWVDEYRNQFKNLIIV